jgi:peptidoglycan/xylan/chitin deacetylase (PgdA/CDA1 family)
MRGSGLRRRPRGPSPRLSVLVYHAIADLAGDPLLERYSVPPGRFAEQLDYLGSRGWAFVGLDQALAALGGGAPLPRRSLLITFDDAYVDLRDAACPILAERGIPAVAFAVAGRLGATNLWDSEHGATSLDLLDGDGLREVAAGGIEVGAHTVSHRKLTELTDEELREEVGAAAAILAGVGLPRPRAFSYPYGHWDGRVARAVADAGYEVAFTVDRGTVAAGADPFTLPRMAVHVDDSGRRLHAKLSVARLPAPVRSALRGAVRLGRRA